MDESRDRFEEGMEAVRLLLEEENVTFEGQFYRFRNVTSLPRPNAAASSALLDRRAGNVGVVASCR